MCAYLAISQEEGIHVASEYKKTKICTLIKSRVILELFITFIQLFMYLRIEKNSREMMNNLKNNESDKSYFEHIK